MYLHSQNTSVRANLASRPALHLGILQIWRHTSLGIEEPGIDEVGSVC